MSAAGKTPSRGRKGRSLQLCIGGSEQCWALPGAGRDPGQLSNLNKTQQFFSHSRTAQQQSKTLLSELGFTQFLPRSLSRANLCVSSWLKLGLPELTFFFSSFQQIKQASTRSAAGHAGAQQTMNAFPFASTLLIGGSLILPFQPQPAMTVTTQLRPRDFCGCYFPSPLLPLHDMGRAQPEVSLGG